MTSAIRRPTAGSLAAGLVLLGAAPAALAADMATGGYLESRLQAGAEEGLAPAPDAAGVLDQLQLGGAGGSVVTYLTPRAGNLQLSLGYAAPKNLGRDERGPGLDLGIGRSAADAVGFAASPTFDLDAGHMLGGGKGDTFAVGGELSLSGWNFGAGYAYENANVAQANTIGASLGYDILTTRFTYSSMNRALDPDAELLVLGADLALSPNLVLQGDLASIGREDGVQATAGTVSIRLNF